MRKEILRFVVLALSVVWAAEVSFGSIVINTNAGANGYAGLDNVLYNDAGSGAISSGTVIRGVSGNGNLFDFFSTSTSEQFVNNSGGGGQANIFGIDTNASDPLLDSDIDYAFTIEPTNPNLGFLGSSGGPSKQRQ